MSDDVQGGVQLTGSPGKLHVVGVLSFDTAAPALKAIQAALAGSEVSELDLAGVRHCDSAGLACVIAVSAEQDRRGRPLKVSNMPDGMRTLAQVCEVGSLIA